MQNFKIFTGKKLDTLCSFAEESLNQYSFLAFSNKTNVILNESQEVELVGKTLAMQGDNLSLSP